MPIKIPENLPGRAILEQERVPLITEDRALRQDIRPLQVAILNLMPDKIRTETQLLRVLGASPLQIEITLLHAGSHTSKTTSAEHLSSFYQTHDDVGHKYYDALIMTGAPVEHLPFEEVTYWPELKRILDWAPTNVFSSLFICWGAQAALHHYHGIPKYDLPAKQFGVFPHDVMKPFDPVITGFDDNFNVPVSRHTEVREADIARHKDLEILVKSRESGVCLVQDAVRRRIYMFNHLEYDAETLKREYERDLEAGLNPNIPHNYYPENNPQNPPRITWRAHRNLLFSNWINQVYQGTPFNLRDVPKYI